MSGNLNWFGSDLRDYRSPDPTFAPAGRSPGEPWPIVGGGCECWVTPESLWTTHYGAVEPGSRVEWNPDCPEHRA